MPLPEEEMGFDDITIYAAKGTPGDDFSKSISKSKKGKAAATVGSKKNKPSLAVVTYGNGVPLTIQAVQAIQNSRPDMDICIVDCPYLTAPPKTLKSLLGSGHISHVLFADVCKYGAGMPLGGHALAMQSSGHLDGISWSVIGASPTYNPLGKMTTFVSIDDINKAVEKLVPV